MPIILNNPTKIPRVIFDELRVYQSLFVDNEFLEEILEFPKMEQIANELDLLCEAKGVIGYHYSRAIEDEILASGLVVSKGSERRNDFLKKHGQLFSTEQRKRIIRLWNSYFSVDQSKARDGRIWFNFTLSALGDGGADNLLTYFGGECIYMPITRDAEIACVLRGLGKPIIVECILNVADLKTFSTHAWGKIFLSSYHTAVNPDAHQYDVDAYIQRNVSPSSIQRIAVATKSSQSSRAWQIN